MGFTVAHKYSALALPLRFEVGSRSLSVFKRTDEVDRAPLRHRRKRWKLEIIGQTLAVILIQLQLHVINYKLHVVEK